jgi:hypothetical protein
MGVVREICVKCPGGPTRIRVADILYFLQHTPPACSPLCPMRLACTVTVHNAVAKCNRPKWSERSAARAAVRAVLSGRYRTRTAAEAATVT